MGLNDRIIARKAGTDSGPSITVLFVAAWRTRYNILTRSLVLAILSGEYRFGPGMRVPGPFFIPGQGVRLSPAKQRSNRLDYASFLASGAAETPRISEEFFTRTWPRRKLLIIHCH